MRSKWVRIAIIVGAMGMGVPVTPSFAEPSAAPASRVPEKKLTITGLENGVTVTAQFNPKEITIDKSVPWRRSSTSKSDPPEVELSSPDGRSMTFELTFDTFDAKTDVYAAYLAKLVALTTVMDPNGPEDKRRPTRVKVQWGPVSLEGVIESTAIKYTAFLPDGTPLRATCTVKIKEASRATFRK